MGDPIQNLAGLVEVRRRRIQPAQTGRRIGRNWDNRLPDLVIDRRRELTHRGDAAGMSERCFHFPASTFAVADFGLGALAIGETQD